MSLTWSPPKLPAKKTAVHRNTAGHAAIVHNGATLRSGTELPARPFMEAPYLDADDGFDAVSEFTKTYQSTGSLDKAFQSTAQKGNASIISGIKSPKWRWPRQTRRSTGRTVGSPRDIRDTDELLDKQQPVRFEK